MNTKPNKNLITKSLSHLFPSSKNAFTLAEVLITLGIIGVVAAMTMPTLVQNYKNREVESKLQKIYTVMNQAIMMSELDNGPKEYWDNTCTAGDETYKDDCKQNFEKYFLKYLKYSKFEERNTTVGKYYTFNIYLNDGSLLSGGYTNKNSIDFYFYPKASNAKKNINTYDSEVFIFRFSPTCTTQECKYHYKKGFEPYAWGVTEYTKEELSENGRRDYTCNKESLYRLYCTALIRLNGWKIPKDYPFKVK